MDRSSFARVALIAAALLLFWLYGLPALRGKSDATQAVPAETYANAPGFVPDALDPPVPGEATSPGSPETICQLKGNRFDAELSTRGAGLTHLHLRDPQYAGTEGFDLSTTPDHERWRSLRTQFRGPKGSDQMKYDRFNWTLAESTGTSCRFTYADADVGIVKTISAGERPFEINVETTLTNLDDVVRSHKFSIEAFAYRPNKDKK